ncbi:MAG: SIR2 family protein [Mycobacterium kyogaense]|uniref:SIR2 family protein n=1 Tax=Mycobacterium kyogaense TaxID=2212479 RepID=UPI002FF97964
MSTSSGAWTSQERMVLSKYPRAIAHLARQNSDSNLSLMFGAGASLSVGIPVWADLVGRIAKHSKVLARKLVGANDGDPLPTAAQVLFEKYALDNRQSIGRLHNTSTHPLFPQMLEAEWRSVIQECLYEKVPGDLSLLQSEDKVYKNYLSIIRQSRITVTYNFDDTIERLLLHDRNPANRVSGRGFQVMTDARLPFRLPKGNIFHVNGFLPRNPLEGVGEGLVFSEGEFADQLLDTVRGANATLTHYLTKNTFLLIGLSLNDENLRHLLRLNAVLNPGHYHYRVHHIRDVKSFDEAKARHLANAHFNNFNLITLFLDDAGIAALGQVLGRGLDDIRNQAVRQGDTVSYVYYLAGVPGVGKTTSFKHLSSLVAHDEWLDERPIEMSKPFNKLTPAERNYVDEWVAEQVKNKNRIIEEEKTRGVGVSIVDRCPLDAITFTKEPGKWAEKAKNLRNEICDDAARRPVQSGHIILLVGEPRDVRMRALVRNRQSGASIEYFKWLQDATKYVYGGKTGRIAGVTVVDVGGLTIAEMLKAVADVVFRQDYIECNLDRRLADYENSRAALPDAAAPS